MPVLLHRIGDAAALGHDLVVPFGPAHTLPSGGYRAMYYGPDGRRYTAATTFATFHWPVPRSISTTTA